MLPTFNNWLPYVDFVVDQRPRALGWHVLTRSCIFVYANSDVIKKTQHVSLYVKMLITYYLKLDGVPSTLGKLCANFGPASISCAPPAPHTSVSSLRRVSRSSVVAVALASLLLCSASESVVDGRPVKPMCSLRTIVLISYFSFWSVKSSFFARNDV